jgi:hypothetical protein
MTTFRSERGEAGSPPLTIASALDYGRFDAIAEFADLAVSYWRSIAEAAIRGEKTTIEVHCRQVSAVTREAFATVKALGRQA